ncbi:heterokaryon incompatibility protein-domain-containing protein, partial [Clohesyomyces aquaticus]
HLCYHSMQTDTLDIFDWATHWIQQCQTKHEKCNNKFIPESSENYLPLRLLDVGGHEDETISLKLSSQIREEHSKDYIALSHCWGEAVNITLTKANIDDMENLHISSLTKTFQHAVRIARALNIRYLWIDSLCIVQDDDAEWESESANMGLVYANSKCVVSASASKDSDGGCFMPKEVFRDDCTLRGSKKGSIVVSASSHRSFEASLKLFTDKAENTVLNTRAWTFQERYLARRVLHFCEGAVFFECNELVVHDGIRYAGSKYPVRAGVRYDGTLHPPNEYEAVQRPVERFTTAPLPGRARGRAAQPSENPEYTEQKKQLEKLLAMSARSGMRGAFELLWRFKGTALAEKVEFHQSWFEMVEKYSARKLTRGTDKLKAMSGIAYFIQKNTTLQYSAGLWKEMLAFNLL